MLLRSLAGRASGLVFVDRPLNLSVVSRACNSRQVTCLASWSAFITFQVTAATTATASQRTVPLLHFQWRHWKKSEQFRLSNFMSESGNIGVGRQNYNGRRKENWWGWKISGAITWLVKLFSMAGHSGGHSKTGMTKILGGIVMRCSEDSTPEEWGSICYDPALGCCKIIPLDQKVHYTERSCSVFPSTLYILYSVRRQPNINSQHSTCTRRKMWIFQWKNPDARKYIALFSVNHL